MEKALVIIPAYNEARNIARVIGEIRKHNGSIDILTVNDGSSDATPEIAAACGSAVVSLPFNLGYGVALQTGYKYALREGYDYVVQMDADGQHDPQYIGKFLEEIAKKEADVLIGSRFLSEKCYKISWARAMGMGLFSGISSFIIKQRVTDSTSGYQCIDKDVLGFFVNDIYPCDYPDADVIIMLHLAGFRIQEIPVVMLANNENKTMHSGIRPLYYVFKMFLSIFVTLLRKRPSGYRRSACS